MTDVEFGELKAMVAHNGDRLERIEDKLDKQDELENRITALETQRNTLKWMLGVAIGAFPILLAGYHFIVNSG